VNENFFKNLLEKHLIYLADSRNFHIEYANQEKNDFLSGRWKYDIETKIKWSELLDTFWIAVILERRVARLAGFWP
jgi:hypothetical protein